MAKFRFPSSYMVSVERFPDRSRPMSFKLAQMGSCPIIFLWLWPASNHEPHCRHVPMDKIWRRTESAPQCRWWQSYAGIYNYCSTCEMKIFKSTSWSFVSIIVLWKGRPLFSLLLWCHQLCGWTWTRCMKTCTIYPQRFYGTNGESRLRVNWLARVQLENSRWNTDGRLVRRCNLC